MNTFWLITTIVLAGERMAKLFLIRHFFKQASSDAVRGAVATWCLPMRATRKRQVATAPCTASPQTVSILQPILSGDATLWQCLRENLNRHSQCPREFIWLVDDNDQAALDGCRQLIAEHPHASIKLHVMAPPPDGCNPKMFKLIAGCEIAAGELIAVLDDDTVLPDAAFEQCLPYLASSQVGLVFGLPYYVSFTNLWSSLVACFVNSNSLLTYIPYTYLSEPLTINGMFYVMRRATVVRLGHLRGLETQLCDDYAVARHVLRHGLQLVQTPLRHAIRTTVTDAAHYLNLLTRWLIFPQASIMRTAAWRVQAVFYGFAFLPALFPLLLTIAALWTATPVAWGVWLGYLALHLALTAYLNQRYLNGATPKKYLPLTLLMALLLPLHLVWSLFAPRRINWRGHVMQVQSDGGFRFIKRRRG